MKKADLKELRDLGIIQEANRQFFHPRGLAIAADLESNIIQIIDSRDDPEGFVFAKLDPEEACNKFKTSQQLLELHRAKRKEMFGSIVQPIKSCCESK